MSFLLQQEYSLVGLLGSLFRGKNVAEIDYDLMMGRETEFIHVWFLYYILTERQKKSRKDTALTHKVKITEYHWKPSSFQK